nr:MAG TPA: hypothetical protein [Caudoviricetes sp.]
MFKVPRKTLCHEYIKKDESHAKNPSFQIFTIHI